MKYDERLAPFQLMVNHRTSLEIVSLTSKIHRQTL